MNSETDYNLLNAQLESVSEGISCDVSVLANASALIYGAMERLNWCGFYLYRDGKLFLGPFQGKVACTVIEIGRGVCGTAAKLDETVLVPNVHEFAGHIACDSASNSEIVIPVHKDGKLFAVLDIDSPDFSRFSEPDRTGLEMTVKTLEKYL